VGGRGDHEPGIDVPKKEQRLEGVRHEKISHTEESYFYLTGKGGGGGGTTQRLEAGQVKSVEPLYHVGEWD